MLTLAVDQEVVAVEDRVEPATADATAADRDQPGAARGDDVEPFVGPAAAARRPELADRPARPVRPQNREDVAAVFDAAGSRIRSRRRRRDEYDKGRRDDEDPNRAAQWCSITRSTRLYSFASSALMK